LDLRHLEYVSFDLTDADDTRSDVEIRGLNAMITRFHHISFVIAYLERQKILLGIIDSRKLLYELPGDLDTLAGLAGFGKVGIVYLVVYQRESSYADKEDCNNQRYEVFLFHTTIMSKTELTQS